MSQKTNIELFDEFAGETFSILYESFPICKDINVENIIEDKYKNTIKEEYTNKDIEILEKYQYIYGETLFWLQDNDLITFKSPKEKRFYVSGEQHKHSKFSCVVLTAKGLKMLKQTPSSISQKEDSLGTQIIKSVKNGAIKDAGKLVSYGLGTMVT